MYLFIFFSFKSIYIIDFVLKKLQCNNDYPSINKYLLSVRHAIRNACTIINELQVLALECL